ncbi:MAG: monovalent cation/H+ antiporter complex subunit F [Acidimicrobiales bacterium]
MTAVTTIALVILAVSAVIAVAKVAASSIVVDRAVALDLGLLIVANALVVVAVRWGDDLLLDLVLLVGLLGFVSGLTVARFVERRGP